MQAYFGIRWLNLDITSSQRTMCLTRSFVDLPLQVDMSKVNVDTMKPWIANRITELLGLDDDVVVEFVFNQLEERVNTSLLHVYFISHISCDSSL